MRVLRASVVRRDAEVHVWGVRRHALIDLNHLIIRLKKGAREYVQNATRARYENARRAPRA